MSVLLETSAGDLVFDLLVEDAPKATLNFLKLCKAKYYNFSPFYNLQSPSFFQGGDPVYPLGDGGSSCWGLTDPEKKYFKPEISSRPHERGYLSMACTAAGLCGSQFFISLGRNESFDRKHAIFGRLAEGFETLDAIAGQPVDAEFRPLRDIRIKHTIVLEDPFEDPPELVDEPAQSPLPTPLQLSTVRIAFDESLEVVGSVEELEAQQRIRDAEANALTLETIGDLPFASVRPPENILFVCKLNPITSSADLELIFGRFGNILSCQVVKDSRTGDSLQYAFIEFDVKEDAEMAYFKMQGVLIDDRRIHVDFSQSVAKVADKTDHRRHHRDRRDVESPHGGRRHTYDMVFDDDARSHRNSHHARSDPHRRRRSRERSPYRDRDSRRHHNSGRRSRDRSGERRR